MHATLRQASLAALLAGLLAACSDPAPTPAGASPADTPTAPAAPVVAAPTDEAGLRQAVREATTAQRVYAPAGDNAIEYYLALRELRKDDSAVATALMELLPYAVIGSEQAVGREDFAEARRLLGLIERADASAPALSRLRESIAAAEANAARRLIAEAEAAKLREQQAAEQAAAAERERQLAEQRARETPAPVAAAPAPAARRPASPPPAAAAAAPGNPANGIGTEVPPTRAAAPALEPTLISAPPPRYPLTAMRRKLEGQVTLEFTVQPDGSVSSPRVISATPEGVFDEAAIVAVSRWRFEPLPRAVTTRRQLQFKP
jgi:protein TonB